MIRIRDISPIPNTSPSLSVTLLAARQAAAGPGVAIERVHVRAGTISLETCYEEYLAGPYILEEVVRAERDGFDAVIIDCAVDPALRGARDAVHIPVVGAGEAGILLAMALGDYYSIVTVQNAVPLMWEKMRGRELQHRLRSVRGVSIGRFDLVRGEEATVNAVSEQARLAVEQDGADVVVLGCTAMSLMAAPIAKCLGVPVIDPAAAAIKLAITQVEMGISHSKRAFPAPPVRVPASA